MNNVLKTCVSPLSLSQASLETNGTKIESKLTPKLISQPGWVGLCKADSVLAKTKVHLCNKAHIGLRNYLFR